MILLMPFRNSATGFRRKLSGRRLANAVRAKLEMLDKSNIFGGCDH
jgi:hypothetical protein